MKTFDWQEVETLYHSALARPAADRASFLRDQCPHDADLYREVVSLVDCALDSEEFLAKPAIELAHQLSASTSQAHPPLDPAARIGQTVSHYRILELAGTGGMGVVYKAVDLDLGRFAALKFFHPFGPGFGNAPQHWIDMLRNEARTCSLLDHPNICMIYEICESDGQPFLAMQWLEGKTLDEELQGIPLPQDRLIDLGVQLADALDAAHHAGILHGDIKPANILITSRGQAKILDFGLARSIQSNERPALLAPLLSGENAVGSASYMSPEQVRGSAVDQRSDLFSLGAVLYEMATGSQAFDGNSLAAILASILQAAPTPPRALNPALLAGLEQVILRAIAKSPDARYENAGKLREALSALHSCNEAEGRPANAHSHRSFSRRILSKYTFFVAGLLIILAMCVPSTLRRLPALARPPLHPPESILVSDFENTTRQPVFDDVLQQSFRVQLQQSPFLSTISAAVAAETLGYMGRPSRELITGEVAHEVCLRNGCSVIVSGSIARLGAKYVLSVNATSARTGKQLDSEQIEVAQPEMVLAESAGMARRLRARLGESPASIQQFDAPLRRVTTRSLEALRAYSAGMKAGLESGDAASIPLLQRAVELDPSFAMANAALGNAYADIGEMSNAYRYLSRAYSSRDSVTTREKLQIESHFLGLTGQLEKSIVVFRSWQQLYPKDPAPYTDLGVMYSLLGRQEHSLEVEQTALTLFPQDGAVYVNLASTQMLLGRVDDAIQTIRLAREHKIDRPVFPLLLYQLAYLKNDRQEMDRQSRQALQQPETEALMLAFESDTAATEGHISEAREFSRRAIDAAQRQHQPESAANFQALSALHEAELGNRAESRRQAGRALASGSNQSAQILSALALAEIGETRRARTVISSLGRLYPNDLLIQRYWIPVIEAAGDIAQQHYADAVEQLEKSAPYDFATPMTPTNVYPYPIYLRGVAYLGLGREDQAAQEFLKITQHRELAGNYLLIARAHRELARAYRQKALRVATSPARTALMQLASTECSAFTRISMQWPRAASPINACSIR